MRAGGRGARVDRGGVFAAQRAHSAGRPRLRPVHHTVPALEWAAEGAGDDARQKVRSRLSPSTLSNTSPSPWPLLFSNN